MPHYRFTIHLKIGKLRTAIRRFSCHDPERERFLVGQRVRGTIGAIIVECIKVEMVEDDRRKFFEG